MSQYMSFDMPIKYDKSGKAVIELEEWREYIRKHENVALLAAETWPTLKAMMAVFQEEVLSRMNKNGERTMPVVDADGVTDGRVLRAKWEGLEIVKGKSDAARARIKEVKDNTSSEPF